MRYMTVAEFRRKVSASGLKLKEQSFRLNARKVYKLTHNDEVVVSGTMKCLRDQAMNGDFVRFGL
jgi:hypothetical protein